MLHIVTVSVSTQVMMVDAEACSSGDRRKSFNQHDNVLMNGIVYQVAVCSGDYPLILQFTRRPHKMFSDCTEECLYGVHCCFTVNMCWQFLKVVIFCSRTYPY